MRVLSRFSLLLMTLLILVGSQLGFAADAPLKKLTVLLDWFPNPDHAPLFVAQQQGFFKQQGLEVNLVGPADPSDPPKLVAAGKADIAITYQPQFLIQVDQGLPLIQIGTLINSPLNCLVALKEGPIKTVADLKGKRIGYSTGGVDTSMLSIMLKHENLDLKDVQQINVHYALSQALLAKQVDAVTGMMRNYEVTQLALAGHPAQVFYPEQYGMPTYNELIFVTHRNLAHDPRLQHFLMAVAQGEAYLQAHPGESWQLFAKNHPELNDQLNRTVWFATLPYFAKYPNLIYEKPFMQFAYFMQANGLIKHAQAFSKYVQ